MSFYNGQQRRRNKPLNPIIKVLLVLSVLFFVYKMWPVAKAWYVNMNG